jgi:translation elongation factor EF-G
MDNQEYDEFGNYIGPDLSNQVDLTETSFHTTNAASLAGGYLNEIDEIIDETETLLTNPANIPDNSRNYRALVDYDSTYDTNVEVIVPQGDALAQHQGIMEDTRINTLQFDQGSMGGDLNKVFTAGYGDTANYHVSFCHSENQLPPMTNSHNIDSYQQLVTDLLSEPWLQRSFSLIGSHLHGKTSILDLFYAQLFPHINVQSRTPQNPTPSSTPHNSKPTTRFSGVFKNAKNTRNFSSAISAPKSRVQDCWPVQYADSHYRERVIGHSTTLKSITLPIEVGMPFSDAGNLTTNGHLNIHKIDSKHNDPENPTPTTGYYSPLPTKTYLFNMVDTPGHSNFLDSTVTAIQRSSPSGVVIVLDCIEGVTMELEVQLEYAIRSASPMVLIINKFDRFITELRLPPEDVYHKLLQLIENINSIILNLYKLYFGSTILTNFTPNSPNQPNNSLSTNEHKYLCPFFNPVDNNVIFMSTLHCYAFTLKSFAHLYLIQQDIKVSHLGSDKRSNLTPTTLPQRIHKLTRLLWGNIYYDSVTQQFLNTAPSQPVLQANIQASGGKKIKNPNNNKPYVRTFVEFILYPLYKVYSACLTGNGDYLEALLGSFYSPSLKMGGENEMGESSTIIAPFSIPSYILSASQDDLMREIIGLWLYAPFHLPILNLKQFPTNSTNFSQKMSQSRTNFSSDPSDSTHTFQRLLSNANCTAQLLSSFILDNLPPPVLRKSYLQNTTLFYQPAISFGPLPSLTTMSQLQSKLTQTYAFSKLHQYQQELIRPLLLPNDRFFPPCRVSLADIISPVPHPNGTSIDYLCRVHTISVNNDPLFTEQDNDDDDANQWVQVTLEDGMSAGAKVKKFDKKAQKIAFRVGDQISFRKSADKTTTPQTFQLIGIYAPSSNRYRTPLSHCYDGNIVVLSFSTQSANPGSQPHNPTLPNQINQSQTDTNLLQRLHIDSHGTFVNHTMIALGQAQRNAKGSRTLVNSNTNLSSSNHLIQLDSYDIKAFLPTFTTPIVHPGRDVFNIAIEPTEAKELPLLLSTISRAQSLYQNCLTITKQSSGSHTLSMRGEFLADDIIHFLRVITGQLLIATNKGQLQSKKIVPPNINQLSFSISTPFYTLREGIQRQSSLHAFAASTGDYNRISSSASPINNFEGLRQVSEVHKKSLSMTSTAPFDQQLRAEELGIHADDLYLAQQYNNWLNWSSRPDSLFLTEPAHLTKVMNSATNSIIQGDNLMPSQQLNYDNSSLVFGSNRLYSLHHKSLKKWEKLSFSQTPWSFGMLDDANTILLDDCVRGSHYNDDNAENSPFDDIFLPTNMWKMDHVNSIVNGFNRLSLEGPLTESPLQNVALKLTELQINKQPLYSTSRYITPTVRKSLASAILLAEPTLYEPIIRGEIIIKPAHQPALLKSLGDRRGAILSQVPIPSTPYTRYSYKMPAIESMGFGVEARLLAKGQARISGGHHLCYESMAVTCGGDPLDSNTPVTLLKVTPKQELQRELMIKTRRRKGMQEFELQNYFHEEMLARLQAGGMEQDEDEEYYEHDEDNQYGQYE